MKPIVILLAAIGTVLLLASSASPAPIFNDDFQSGIDPGRWELYPVGGTCWAPYVEACVGMIRSPAQPSPVWPDPRQDNILTARADFADFVVTWDMRFHTEGWDMDYRMVYLRCDNAPSPHGYWISVGVSVPPSGNRDFLSVSTYKPDGSTEGLGDVDYPWDLGTWYRFKAQFVGGALDVKVWPRDNPEPAAWTLHVQDASATFSQGRIGFGDYWESVTDVDNVVVSSIGADVSTLPLRNPQVPLNGSELQSYFNGLGESVNVYADQLAAQVCSTSVSGNSTATLMIELSGNANQNSFGIYNALEGWFHNVPPPQTTYEIFPANAGAGWVALVNFLSSGNLVVNLFDNTGTLVRHEDHGPAFLTKIGFYLARPGGGLLLSQDGLNGGGVPQALMYAGTGRNWGEVWLCWEDTHPADCSDRDFNDAVLVLQSLQPVRTLPSTWSALKARYR